MNETVPPKTQEPTPAKIMRPTVRFDAMDWLHYLEQVDAPMEQKIELIDTLWSIVNGFADFGWNISFSPESCGEDLDLYAALSAAVVKSNEIDNAKKGDAA